MISVPYQMKRRKDKFSIATLLRVNTETNVMILQNTDNNKFVTPLVYFVF